MTVLRDIHQHLVPGWREVWVIKESVRPRKRILSNDIACQTRKHVLQVDVSASPFQGFEPCYQLVQDGLYARLESVKGGF